MPQTGGVNGNWQEKTLKFAEWNKVKRKPGTKSELKRNGEKVLVSRARQTYLRSQIVLTILFLILRVDWAKGYWSELENIYVNIQIFISMNTFAVKSVILCLTGGTLIIIEASKNSCFVLRNLISFKCCNWKQ